MESPLSENQPPDSPTLSAESETQNSELWTVQKILNWTTGYLQKHACESPRLESEVLLAHARNCQRIQLYTDFNQPVDDLVRAKMRGLVQRRVQGEPVAYLVGYREFFSLDFHLTPGVFIPRPDTESLVLEALEKLQNVSSPRILELCVGSGCISVSLAVQKPDATLTAVDLSPLACEATKQNASRHNVLNSVHVLQGNLFDALDVQSQNENQKYDLLISNPPYVCTHEIERLARDIRDFEPHAALDGGEDGLDIVRKILDEGPSYVKPGGWCLLEMDPMQIESCLEMASDSKSWTQGRSRKDLSGLQRCVILQRSED